MSSSCLLNDFRCTLGLEQRGKLCSLSRSNMTLESAAAISLFMLIISTFYDFFFPPENLA